MSNMIMSSHLSSATVIIVKPQSTNVPHPQAFWTLPDMMIPPQKKSSKTQLFPLLSSFLTQFLQRKTVRNQTGKKCRKLMKTSPSVPLFSLPGAERLQDMQVVRDPWCQECYPFHEPVRARPLPVRPDPHLPEGCDVSNLHNETVLLAPLKPAGIGRPRRFSCCFTASPHLRSVPRHSPGRANSLKSKVYECSLLDLSFSVLQSPATVLLARHLSADLTGIPPSLENTAHLELLQAACSIHYCSVCTQNNSGSQSGFWASPPSWQLPTCLSLASSS